jgi:uncharacterized protein (DUF362 family)
MTSLQDTDNGRVFTKQFTSWKDSVVSLLIATDLAERLNSEQQILIKPNLVEALDPPITTPVEIVGALIDYLRSISPEYHIIIGEGCGSLAYDTYHVFKNFGYTELAKEKKVTLLDLNDEELIKKKDSNCRRWPEMYLPQIGYDSFLISVPVLKAHSLAGVTLTMKNMMGLVPPAHYQQGGHWKKASFHQGIQEAVSDLNKYRTPDFTLLDATVGMQEAHLWGPTCDPPVNRIAAGFDPVAIDTYGCMLLGRDWRDIGHIRMAHTRLGMAEPLTVVEV